MSSTDPTSGQYDAKSGAVGRELVSRMPQLTWERHGRMAIDNAQRNLAHIDQGRSLAALHRAPIGSDDAVVIAAGPSIKRQDPVAKLKAENFQGAIIATESALMYCLRNGVVPHLTVTLDPHASRIVRWFGDAKLSPAAIAADDYYSRQDMDEAFANEMRANQEALALLNEHGSKIRIALATSASQAVVERVLDIGMDIYWWNPMLDDPDVPGSRTAELQKLNRLPAMNAGGNVGTCAWMLASAVLEKRRVALTGMDFSYYEGTPYRNTQYYNEAVALVGEENLDSIFMRVFNPFTGSWFFTDPAYMWYRECFLDMVADADCKTYNCTGGGILFGDNINFVTLEAFLSTSGASD
jgi:hypothetical protein